MDGIMPLENIIVIAATNRPDIVDSAVLRPGRFDRLIYVPEPDEAARLEIFKIHTKNMPLSNDVDIKEHRMTKGYSGADISSVCREAAMNALRRDINAKEVTFSDFEKAMEEVPPSISPEIENWYRSFMNQVRRLQKPVPFVV
jgi:transitional endoplasmic reticulum ATPase